MLEQWLYERVMKTKASTKLKLFETNRLPSAIAVFPVPGWPAIKTARPAIRP
jgi:hypothetical protein